MQVGSRRTCALPQEAGLLLCPGGHLPLGNVGSRLPKCSIFIKKKKKAGNLDFRGKLPVFTYWQPIPNYFKKMAWVKPNTGCREPLDLKCLSSQGKVGGEDI